MIKSRSFVILSLTSLITGRVINHPKKGQSFKRRIIKNSKRELSCKDLLIRSQIGVNRNHQDRSDKILQYIMIIKSLCLLTINLKSKTPDKRLQLNTLSSHLIQNPPEDKLLTIPNLVKSLKLEIQHLHSRTETQ